MLVLNTIASHAKIALDQAVAAVFNDSSLDRCELLSNTEMLQITLESDHAFELVGPFDFEEALGRSEFERTAAMYAARLRCKIFEALYEAGVITSAAFILKHADAASWYIQLRETLMVDCDES